MQKNNPKSRMFRFYSPKNEKVVVVRTVDARDFARWLDEQDWVLSYVPSVPLDPEQVRSVCASGIRRAYATESWCTDFHITGVDETQIVREILLRRFLDKKSEIEKLELSRRYWMARGVTDWKVVII